MKTVQLREYTIKPGQLGAFVDMWARTVKPLRERTGFVIEGAWTVPAAERFVWIVSHDGPAGWEAANTAYYDSPERKAMDPDPASFILEQRTTLIEPV